MLTQTDLQSIKKLVDTSLQKALKDYVTKDEFHSTLKKYATKKDMDRGFRTMTRKLNLIISFFDKEHRELDERVGRLENHVFG